MEIDEQDRIRVNVVFEGGGAKGVAYVGALKALERRKACIAAAAGASAGAITATLVAAGCTSDELNAHLPNGLGHLAAQIPQDTSGLWSIIRHRQVIRGLLQRLRTTGGALDNGGLRGWLAGLLAAKLRCADGASVTFSELYDKTGIELYVVAADISLGRLMVFHHRITPICQVVESVLASSAIPGALPSGKLVINESRQPEPERLHTLVDGGVWSNFPDFVFKDDSFRDYWKLGPVEGKVIGFLLHKTDKSVATLSADDYPTVQTGDDAIDRPARTARFQRSDDDQPPRTEAVLRGEDIDRSLTGSWLGYSVFLLGFLGFLATMVGPLAWAPLRDLRLLVPLEFASLVLLILTLVILPQSSQSMSTSEHGWPRNRVTMLANIFLSVLATWQMMLAVWVILILSLAFALIEHPQVNTTVTFFSWFLVIAFTMLLLANVVVLTSLAILRGAVRDWGWGVARTYFASSGAPEWRGWVNGDWIVRLPIPHEVSTLSFAVHEQTIAESEDLVLPKMRKIAEDAAYTQLKPILSVPSENN